MTNKQTQILILFVNTEGEMYRNYGYFKTYYIFNLAVSYSQNLEGCIAAEISSFYIVKFPSFLSCKEALNY